MSKRKDNMTSKRWTYLKNLQPGRGVRHDFNKGERAVCDNDTKRVRRMHRRSGHITNRQQKLEVKNARRIARLRAAWELTGSIGVAKSAGHVHG